MDLRIIDNTVLIVLLFHNTDKEGLILLIGIDLAIDSTIRFDFYVIFLLSFHLQSSLRINDPV